MSKTLDEFQKEVGEWGEAMFPGSSLLSIEKHFHEEVKEFMSAATWGEAEMEAADIVLLLLHFCHRRDVSLMQLMEAKMKVNRTRKWGEPGEKGYSKHED